MHACMAQEPEDACKTQLIELGQQHMATTTDWQLTARWQVVDGTYAPIPASKAFIPIVKHTGIPTASIYIVYPP
jgi:hypothetical protein